jgi:hypothetical protein
MLQGREQQGRDRTEYGDHDEHPELRHPRTRAPKEYEGPDRRSKQRCCENATTEPTLAPFPHRHGADGHDGANGRSKGDRVVRVDDPLRAAE